MWGRAPTDFLFPKLTNCSVLHILLATSFTFPFFLPTLILHLYCPKGGREENCEWYKHGSFLYRFYININSPIQWVESLIKKLISGSSFPAVDSPRNNKRSLWPDGMADCAVLSLALSTLLSYPPALCQLCFRSMRGIKVNCPRKGSQNHRR